MNFLIILGITTMLFSLLLLLSAVIINRRVVTMNKSIIEKVFPGAVEAISEGKCPMCGNPIDDSEFRDELSRKEYSISGLCQMCQDDVVGA